VSNRFLRRHQTWTTGNEAQAKPPITISGMKTVSTDAASAPNIPAMKENISRREGVMCKSAWSNIRFNCNAA
jgi:hypothetical protein